MNKLIHTRLPRAPEGRSTSVQSYITPSALERWDPAVRASASEADQSISVLEPIGYDPWTGGGVTSRRVAAALRSIGAGNPVTVNVNSPGGDVFEAMAIYNMLREHDGEVTVKVLGLAASGASVIAMAGDTVQVARASFFVIHNAWVVAMGNRHGLRGYADNLELVDRAMADIYAARTGQSTDEVGKLMDNETWIGGSDAVEQGFANELLPADQVAHEGEGESKARAAAYRLDAALARVGISRTERRELLREYVAGTSRATGQGGMLRAAEDDMPRAVLNLFSGLNLSFDYQEFMR